jgi:hypothetical protein
LRSDAKRARSALPTQIARGSDAIARLRTTQLRLIFTQLRLIFTQLRLNSDAIASDLGRNCVGFWAQLRHDLRVSLLCPEVFSDRPFL